MPERKNDESVPPSSTSAERADSSAAASAGDVAAKK